MFSLRYSSGWAGYLVYTIPACFQRYGLLASCNLTSCSWTRQFIPSALDLTLLRHWAPLLLWRTICFSSAMVYDFTHHMLGQQAFYQQQCTLGYLEEDWPLQVRAGIKCVSWVLLITLIFYSCLLLFPHKYKLKDLSKAEWSWGGCSWKTEFVCKSYA